MTTKKQVLDRLNKIHPGAELEEDSNRITYYVQITAPHGHFWEGEGIHSRVISWGAGNNKSEFWDEVLSELNNLGNPVECHVCHCDEFDHKMGVCEYWEES